MGKIKPLTTEDIRASITDEKAQQQGYANAEMLRKELRLGDIAGHWRVTKSDEDVKAYHALFAELIAEGWNPHSLDFDQALPKRLMPELPPQWRKVKNKSEG
jgi:hypothetical protein